MERVKSNDGHLATVKWRGVLKDAKGNEDEWLGVEWDDPTRGRHNGEYQGKKLFDVSVPKSGSFLRASSVKYGKALSEMIGDYPLTGGWLSVDNTDLSCVGKFEQFPESVRTVNVAHTMVGSFKFIWDLLDVAPKVETLILGQLHFVEFTPATRKYDLQEIVVNGTNIGKEQLQILIDALPNLKRIDVSYCEPPPLEMLLQLKGLVSVHIDGLKIKDFEYVSRTVGTLPELEVLSVSNNEIERIVYVDGTFKKLKCLMMKTNKLADIYAVDGVSQFPALEDLQIQRNPLQDNVGEIEARMILVARHPNIKKLNGSPITPAELYQSEIGYLEHYAREVAAGGIAKHPRWEALVEKYGPPAMPVEKPAADAKKRVKVTFVFGEERVEKTIPLTMKIGSLATNVARLFKVKGTELELAIESGNYKTYLPYPEQSLAEVGCTDGATIYAGRVGDHLFDEVQQARTFRIRSISEQINETD